MVDEAAERYLLEMVGLLWDNGWQPAELLRHGRRSLTAPAARLVGSLIATDHARRRAQTLDPIWVAQVEGLDLPPADGRKGWLRRWQTGEGLDRVAATEALVATAAELPSLRPLEVLIAPPGQRTPLANMASMGTTGTSDPILLKVRRLLAKAESSEFEAEASAFTAKAQELMARHAIDAAMVDAGHDVTEQPVVIRVPVDDPYVDAKSLLLHVVATEGRCRAVYMPDLALCTILGFATDVAAAELLFTSLLVQAQSALATAARTAPPGSRVRSRRYRSSFLLSYANRIGDRLNEINQAVIAEADVQNGPSLLPALRARSDVLDKAMNERYRDLRSLPVSGANDPAGWAGGRVAADNARLTGADLEATRAS